jgi:hypothetical protein
LSEEHYAYTGVCDHQVLQPWRGCRNCPDNCLDTGVWSTELDLQMVDPKDVSSDSVSATVVL